VGIGLLLGLVNAWSVLKKMGLLHNVIYDQKLDILAVTETWFRESEPDIIKLDLAPTGYDV